MTEEQPTPDGLMGFFQREMRGLRVDVRGDIDRLAKQTAEEHANVRGDLQDLASEVRMVTSTANAAKALADANTASIASQATMLIDHLKEHHDQAKVEEGVERERKRWVEVVKFVLTEGAKVGIGVGGTLAVLLLKGLV